MLWQTYRSGMIKVYIKLKIGSIHNKQNKGKLITRRQSHKSHKCFLTCFFGHFIGNNVLYAGGVSF